MITKATVRAIDIICILSFLGHNVVNCQHVGTGLPALKYLSRYLYRGVIAENNILSCRDGKVTFRYHDSETQQEQTRTLKGEAFLWLVQLILRVMIAPNPLRARPVFKCPRCKAMMEIVAFRRPVYLTG